MEVGEREKLMLRDNFLMEKVRYILSSPSQRNQFRSYASDEDKVDFFLNHFIMNDYAIRQLKNLYLSSEQGVRMFLTIVDDIINDID